MGQRLGHLKSQEKKLDVVEMRMLRFMWMDKIRNDFISSTVKVGLISRKVKEGRLK